MHLAWTGSLYSSLKLLLQRGICGIALPFGTSAVDGTSILSQEFRAQLNRRLIDLFGFEDDIFKDHAYIIGHKLIMSPANIQQIVKMGTP